MTEHPTHTRLICVPRILEVGAGAMKRVAEWLHASDFPLGSVLVVCGEGPSHHFGTMVAEAIEEKGGSSSVRFGFLGSHAEARVLGELAGALGASLLVAVGGGRVIDIAKLAASYADLDVVSVPTSIANDGLCSPIASLKDAGGTNRSVAARMPAAVILDTEVVASAPAETIRAGLGDLLSNLTALQDWQLAHQRSRDTYDGYAALIAEGASRPLLSARTLVGVETVELLAKGLILSGLAMATSGTSRPCSGAEHLISHSLDELLGRRARLHGEQVALGTIIACEAHGYLKEEMRAVFERCGLPTSPAHLGLSGATLMRAVVEAPSTRPDRYTVLDEVASTPEAVQELLGRAFPESAADFASGWWDEHARA